MEPLYDIPQSWAWTILENIGEISSGGTPKTSDDGNFDGDIPWITPADLTGYKAQYIANGKRNISEKGLRSSSARLLPEGTVLFSSRAPIGYVVIAANPLCTNQGFKNLTPAGQVSSEYVYYYLKGNKDLAESLASGTTFLELSASRFAKIPIPLAPLNEQRRIVSKIEELFSDLDEGETALRRVQSLLASYRQAVLKAAVTGELTKEWREANQHRLESGEALLQRILQARREQWNGRGQYQEPQPPDIDELPDLPEGWVWASIDQLFNVYVGSTPSRKEPSYWGGDIPWVSSGEVAFCRISDTKEKITRQGYENSSVKLHPKGTVLLAMIGEGRTRGQAAILDIEACHNQNSASIRVSETDIPPGYIYYLLMYSYEQNRRMGQGGNQPALNGMKIKGLTVPLAPLEEMKEIVNQIEIISSRIDALEIWCKTELARSATLRQSILKAAFSGKLVLQDPNDEPASVLVERIQAARPSPSPSKPTSRTGAKTQPKMQPTLWESS